MNINLKLTGSQKRKLKRIAHETSKKIEAMRCRILLLINKSNSVKEVSRMVGCVRATVYRTLYSFEYYGSDCVIDRRNLRPPLKVTDYIYEKLKEYVSGYPQNYGWARSTWTLELFALQIEKDCKLKLSISHIRNLLPQINCRLGRARAALRIPVRGRRKVLKRLEKLIKKSSSKHEVFYVDEADIDLNPRIGFTYIERGNQPIVLTPGKNIKRYIAGALNARTGKIIHTTGKNKNSWLFISLLNSLSGKYRKAKKIHLIVDNYIIHKSQYTERALKRLNDRVVLHFLPPYSPESNVIERLWKQLHDNVTRNHRNETIDGLLSATYKFLEAAQPFPGTKVSTRRLRKAA